jgi:hypothetical protein
MVSRRFGTRSKFIAIPAGPALSCTSVPVLVMKGNMKARLILPAILVFFAIGLRTLPAAAADTATALSAAAILQRSAETYAALTNYSDEGATASKLGNITAASYTFTIKLARTNLYQICWYAPDQIYVPKGVVWSAGDGDYLWMGADFKPRKSASREMALAGATGISGGAAASLPGTFFKMRWGNQLAGTAGTRRLADEKIGDTDCFVLTHDHGGRTNTLWIGKKDFLIHQVENDTSGDLIKKTLEEQAKTHPEVRSILEQSGPDMFQNSRTIEVHRDIKLNQPMRRADFAFHPPEKSGH